MAFDRDSGPWRSVGGANGPSPPHQARRTEPNGRAVRGRRGPKTYVKSDENPRHMPERQNCGAFVTRDYARVFTPDGVDEPRVCPRCEDMVRDGAEVRSARSPRNS